MIFGPGTANYWVVSAFTNENGVSFESAMKMGAENIELDQIDY